VQSVSRPSLELIGHIYEAALEPQQWSAVLAAVQAELRAQTSIVYLEDVQALEASFEVRRGLDPELMRSYYRYYIQKDPFFAYRLTQPVGTVTTSHQVVPDPEFEQSEYYRDFLRPLGCFYTAGGHIAKDAHRVGVFSLQREREAGPFSEDERATLQALFPHLGRAFQIGRQLAAGQVERQAMLSMLERLPTGVLLLDERCRVVFLNRRAEAMLAAGDGLVMAPQGLTASAQDLQPVLERLLRGAVETGAGRGSDSGGAMLLPAVSSRESYQVLVTPLRTERLRMGLGRDRICAAVFVQFRNSKPTLSVELLRDLFGLTPAEARVAVALAQGRNPGEIAAEADTSRFTVRAQLSAIYEKLGVHRQAELVQRVLSSPAALGSADGEPTE
jgi:DNA-binding CsgD family transcriptional regulator/PAS domain-containing protein